MQLQSFYLLLVGCCKAEKATWAGLCCAACSWRYPDAELLATRLKSIPALPGLTYSRIRPYKLDSS